MMMKRQFERRTTGVTSAAVVAVVLGVACREAPNAIPPESEPKSEVTVTGGEAFHGLLEYRSKDAKLALVRPDFLTAAEAGLPEGVSVVGVSAGGAHRAYPLYVLKNHQIVNDRLGDTPIAASW